MSTGVRPEQLDLNLLRIFLMVAECGNVTKAADRLYLTQSAVSAAMKRLQDALDTPLLARQGRGVVLTARGERLAAQARPHVQALFEAALAPPRFDPAESARVLRIGLSDAAECWLLPSLLRRLAERAPKVRVVAVPVQFRTLATLMHSSQLDLAVSVADDLPMGLRREPLLHARLVCLFDQSMLSLPKKLTMARYLAEEHIVVSYAADLRGVVEDSSEHTRRVRCSVASFHAIPSLVLGSTLIATAPDLLAHDVVRTWPQLDTRPFPFDTGSTPIELIWSEAKDDEANEFARALVRELVADLPARRAT